MCSNGFTLPEYVLQLLQLGAQTVIRIVDRNSFSGTKMIVLSTQEMLELLIGRRAFDTVSNDNFIDYIKSRRHLAPFTPCSYITGQIKGTSANTLKKNYQ